MRIDSYEKFLTQFDLYDADNLSYHIRNGHPEATFASEIGEPNEENWWLWREFLRTVFERYTPVTNVMPEFNNVLAANPRLKHHFLHVSGLNPMLVAYTEDEDRGLRDIQTTTKIGRYLTRYAPDFNTSYYSNQYLVSQCPPVLKFAHDRETIHRVYANGPHSCMVNTYRYDYDDNKVYAVEVYAGPDTAVAYIGDYRIAGGVTARSVVNTKDNHWVRCYGNDEVLRALLNKAGFSPGSLEGCRVLRMLDSNYDPIMPYLDGVQRASYYNDEYLVITENGEYRCDKTDGTCVKEDEYVCADCEQGYSDEDEGSHLDHGWVCDSCLSNNYTYAYTGSGQEYISNDEGIYEYNGDYYTSSGLERHNLILLEDGEVYHQEDVAEDYLNDDNLFPADDAVKVVDDSGEGVTQINNIHPNAYELSFDLTNEVVHLDRDYEDVISEELTTLEELIALYPEALEYWWLHANIHTTLSYHFRKVIRHVIRAVVATQADDTRRNTYNYLWRINSANQSTYAQAA